MMNVLFNKVSSQLQIIYNNLLKSSKTLKKIKAYFIYINNRHKITRKIRKKEKIKKIDKTVCLHKSKQFVSFSFQSLYTF